jgi:hypothetical protein
LHNRVVGQFDPALFLEPLTVTVFTLDEAQIALTLACL